jgi:hypothetical protein
MHGIWKTFSVPLIMALGLWGCGDINVESNTGTGGTGGNQANNAPRNGGNGDGQSTQTETGDGPDAYFVAVQCGPSQQNEIGIQWSNLATMVTGADDKGIKLTLMFAPQWAEWLSDKPDELNKVQQWRDAGHEVGGLHQSVYYEDGWDGYTDLTEEAYLDILAFTPSNDAYRGTLDDWQTALEALNSDLNSGCSGAQVDKGSMPTNIAYDTCAGFSQRDEDALGTRSATLEIADAGVNDFILEGVVAGVTRKWLTYAPLSSFDALDGAENLFGRLDGGVYGVMVNGHGTGSSVMESWLTILDAFDQGQGSYTLKAIVEEALLPTRNLSAEVLDAIYDDE